MDAKDKDKGKNKGTMFGWTKKIKATASQVTPAKLAPKGTLSGAAASIKEQVTGQKVDIPDTSSPIMDSKCKELDQSSAFMEAILKGMKKQQKALKVYIESSEDVTEAYLAYAGSTPSDDLCQTLEQWAKYENFYRSILSHLHTHSTKVQESMNEWIVNGIPPARAEKKKFEAQRRILDQANLKAARAERDGLPQPKMKEIIQEKEAKETQYRQAGEKAYAKIIDTVEQTKFNNIFQINEHFYGYYNFLKQGWDHAQGEQGKFDAAKSKAQTDQTQFKMNSLNRPKNVWAPASIGGDTNRVFAMPYQQVIERDKPEGNILPFLDQCFKYLEDKGLTTTGLFRVSPPKPDLDALREKIDKAIEVDIYEQEEVHMVSGLIKLFLRELPAPLLTFELYRQWMGVLDEPAATKASKARDVIRQLPECNRVLLSRLMSLCTKIMMHQDENKMTVDNLAIVLCPSILYDKDPDPVTMVQDIQRANGVMVLLVSKYNEIFGDGSPSTENSASTSTSSVAASSPPPPTSPPPGPPLTTPPSRGSATTPAAGASTTPTASTTATAAKPTATPITIPPPPPPAGPPPGPPPAGVKANPPPPSGAPPPVKKADEAVISEESAGHTHPDKIIEEKDGNKTIITPEIPTLPLEKLLQLLGDMESTASYYKQLYELFEGSYMFTRASHNMKEFTAEEVNALNQAFQVVGRAIKNMLGFIKEYTVVFPGEVGKRILSAANKVRPHVKSLISYIKSYAGGQKLPISGLIQATREFLIGTYQMYLICNSASQMDELSQSGLSVRSLVVQLEKLLTDAPTQSTVSLSVNNLQNHTLKFTSLLRARLPDINDGAVQQQLSVVVEGAELSIGEVFDEARNMLIKNDLEMTPVFEEKTNALSKLVEEVLLQRHLIDQALAEAHVPTMIENTWEQLESIVALHQEDENPRMLELVKCVTELANIVRQLGSQYPTVTEKPAEWMATSEKVVVQFDHVLRLVEQVVSEVDDESLAETIRSFIETVQHFLVQFKICTAATAFGICVAGYESSSFITPLKDFAYVTYPFMYNFRDACTVDDTAEAAQ